MDATKIKRKHEGIKRKRENEGINRRKDTLVKKAYELGQFEGIRCGIDYSQAWSVYYVQIQGS